MAKDLRTFLKQYESDYPEDVVHIEKEINNNQEITAIVAKLEKQYKYPLLIFHNVINPEGNPSGHWVVTNVLASRTRYARICNSTFETLGRDVYQRTRTQRQTPTVIPKNQAPIKEIIKKSGQIKLLEFPVLVHNEMDAGNYFSGAFLVTYDPDSGIDNCALQRGWVFDKDTIRVLVAMLMHNGLNLYKHEQKNQDMKVAYWMGHHPLAYIGGLAKLPYPSSHYEAIGGMLEEPLRLVPSETLGDDFLVPADAEIVVEGIIEANKRYAEGPFGEYPRHVGAQLLSPQFKVTAITHRNNAIWYDIAAGWADHNGAGSPPIEGQLWETLKGRFPSLQNVYMPISGTGRFHAYLQFKNPGPTDAKQAIIMATTLMSGIVKHAFAFDDDVDIFDEKEVLWAIATRSQWAKDVVILPHTRGGALDPSSGLPGEDAAGGIDCTKPWGESFEEKVRVEQSILDKIDIKDYISTKDINKIKIERS